MTQHLSDSTKWRLATYVLEGESFSEVAERFNISKAGSAKIFHKTKYKIFPLISERESLGLDMECLKSLKKGWREVKGI